MGKLIALGVLIFIVCFVVKQIYLFGKASADIPKEPSKDPTKREKEKNTLDERIELVQSEIRRLDVELPKDIELTKEKLAKKEQELEELQKIKEKYNN